MAVDAAGYGIGLALAGVAAVRRGKAVHPHGAVYEAELVVPGHHDALGRTELFGAPARRPAVVRFSRSLGLPRPLPDLLGMSLRVLDAYGTDRHQDFLMVTSVDAPVLHHLFVPASDVQQRPYSSSLRYRACGETFLVVPFRARSRHDSRTATSSNGLRRPRPRAPSCSTSPWQRCGDASGLWPRSAWQTRSRPRPTPCGSIRGTPVAASSRRDC